MSLKWVSPGRYMWDTGEFWGYITFENETHILLDMKLSRMGTYVMYKDTGKGEWANREQNDFYEDFYKVK